MLYSNNFDRRKRRVRKKIAAISSGKPRLSIFRSSRYIYAQLIDDNFGISIASASTNEKDVRSMSKGLTKESAALVGKMIADRAIAKGIKQVVFDRGGYLYHGRIKALADSARAAGLEF